jgi:ACS family tartrate transporter-like MFS transporter
MIGWIKDQTGSFLGGLYFVAELPIYSAMLTLVLSRSLRRRESALAAAHS